MMACEPIPVCRDRQPAASCEDYGRPDLCEADPACEVVLVEVCDMGGDPACPPDDPNCFIAPPICVPFPECHPRRDFCPNLDADVCSVTDGCVSLVQADGGFAGCAFAGRCEGLDEFQCQLHPNCAFVIGAEPPPPDACACIEGPDGEVLCPVDCDPARPAPAGECLPVP